MSLWVIIVLVALAIKYDDLFLYLIICANN